MWSFIEAGTLAIPSCRSNLGTISLVSVMPAGICRRHSWIQLPRHTTPPDFAAAAGKHVVCRPIDASGSLLDAANLSFGGARNSSPVSLELRFPSIHCEELSPREETLPAGVAAESTTGEEEFGPQAAGLLGPSLSGLLTPPWAKLSLAIHCEGELPAGPMVLVLDQVSPALARRDLVRQEPSRSFSAPQEPIPRGPIRQAPVQRAISPRELVRRELVLLALGLLVLFLPERVPSASSRQLRAGRSPCG